MGYNGPDDGFNPDKVIIPNNPFDIDLSTGYDDGYIPSSTVLMSADDWDKQYGK